MSSTKEKWHDATDRRKDSFTKNTDSPQKKSLSNLIKPLHCIVRIVKRPAVKLEPESKFKTPTHSRELVTSASEKSIHLTDEGLKAPEKALECISKKEPKYRYASLNDLIFEARQLRRVADDSPHYFGTYASKIEYDAKRAKSLHKSPPPISIQGKEHSPDTVLRVLKGYLTEKEHYNPTTAAEKEILGHYQKQAHTAILGRLQKKAADNAGSLNEFEKKLLKGETSLSAISKELREMPARFADAYKEEEALQIKALKALGRQHALNKEVKALQEKTQKLNVFERHLIQIHKGREQQYKMSSPLTVRAEGRYDTLLEKPESSWSEEDKAFVQYVKKTLSTHEKFTKENNIDFDEDLLDALLTNGGHILDDPRLIDVRSNDILAKSTIRKLLRKFKDKNPQTEKAKWTIIHEHVRESMPRDVEEFMSELEQPPNKIAPSLGLYLNRKAGVCIDKAILAKYLASKLGLKGISINSGVLVLPNGSMGAHAWNLVKIDGTNYLLDAEQGIFKPFTEDLQKRYFHGMSVARYKALKAAGQIP